jgi:RNA polymerase primary sigma factor
MDTLKDYLTEIGRYPLLSGEQEIQLSRQVRRMMELQAMAGDRSKAEQREIKRGMRARDTIMNCNLRLVVHIAKRYVTRLKSNGMDMMDLIQEGSIGLHRAAELFDGSKGYKFSTYAYWWIRQAITRAIDTKERLIRVPQHTLDQVYKAARLQREHLQQTGEPMPTALLAQEMGLAMNELQMIMQRNIPHRSLDQLVHTDGSPLVDLIPSNDPEVGDTLAPEYAEQLQLAFFRLDERDRYIVSAYHGLNGPEQTQKKISETLGITRSRVGQRRDCAIRRLRLMLASKKGAQFDFRDVSSSLPKQA